MVLSFPKFGDGLVAWVALAPLLVALPGTAGLTAFRLGYVTGAVSALGLLYWTSFVVVQYGGLSLPAGIAIMVALCLTVALFPSVFAWATARLLSAFGPAGVLLAPFVWVATELARAHTLFSFPWCLLGYSQHRYLPVIQIASVTAVYGVSFLLAASSALLALASSSPRHRRGALVALLLILAALWGGGSWVLQQPVRETGRIRIGLVQGGIRQDEKWAPENALRNIGRHLDLTDEAAAQGARLVVWPESSVPYLFDHNRGVAEILRSRARERGVYLLFGNDDRLEEPDGTSRLYVGAKMLTPGGELSYRYHKIHLVPFGEYVPLQALFTLGGRHAAKLVQEVSDFTPGREHTLAEVDGHPLGGFICYEAIFPALVRAFTARGAELLVNITNDAWYGTTSAPHQHMAMAALRAVENNRYLVRAANTGITAVVDPRGRVLAPTRLFDSTVVVREVPLVAETSVYARHGDVFARGCAAAALASLLAARRRRIP